MSVKLFVWDFHGVLEKDNDLAVLEISNKILEQEGFSERFSSEDNRRYYGLKWYEYFERLLPHLDKEQHLALQAACFAFAEANTDVLAKHIKPADHAAEVLGEIFRAGHDQILLSNTRPNDLWWFVKTVGLTTYLPKNKIFGVNAHQKHGSKQEALAAYVKDKSFGKIIIIGDSLSDMALKAVAGGTTYFYTHPQLMFNEPVLADHIITDLRDIVINELE